MRSGDAPKQETAVSCPAEQHKRSLIESRKPGSPPARFLVDVDGLGNMPSNRRAVPRQSGMTLPDRLLCAVICGDIHINGKTAPVDPAKQALTPGRIADSALARIKASLGRLETGGTSEASINP